MAVTIPAGDDPHAEALRDVLLPLAARARPTVLRLHLRPVEYVCSTALSLLLALNRAAAATGGRVLLVNVPPALWALLQLTRLDTVLDCRPA